MSSMVVALPVRGNNDKRQTTSCAIFQGPTRPTKQKDFTNDGFRKHPSSVYTALYHTMLYQNRIHHTRLYHTILQGFLSLTEPQVPKGAWGGRGSAQNRARGAQLAKARWPCEDCETVHLRTAPSWSLRKCTQSDVYIHMHIYIYIYM